jgi:uncharacterized protein (DUF1919 family)
MTEETRAIMKESKVSHLTMKKLKTQSAIRKYVNLKNLRFLMLDIRDHLLTHYERRMLRNQDFSIISNDCVAGGMYRKLGISYNTPTVGLFFFAEDYIKFLENFRYYIQKPLKFVQKSRFPEVELLEISNYPVGLLGDDIEIHFIHYKTEQEAAAKWKKRCKRINFSNLFFIFVQKYLFKKQYLQRFESLPFKHKIFFSSKKRNSPLSVFLKDYQAIGLVGDLFNERKYEKYFDVIKWLNGEQDFSN